MIEIEWSPQEILETSDELGKILLHHHGNLSQHEKEEIQYAMQMLDDVADYMAMVEKGELDEEETEED